MFSYFSVMEFTELLLLKKHLITFHHLSLVPAVPT